MRFLLIILSFVFAFDIRGQTSADYASLSAAPTPSIGIAVVDLFTDKFRRMHYRKRWRNMIRFGAFLCCSDAYETLFQCSLGISQYLQRRLKT